MGSLPRNYEVCGKRGVPAQVDLPAFWRDEGVGELRGVRRLFGDAEMVRCEGGASLAEARPEKVLAEKVLAERAAGDGARAAKFDVMAPVEDEAYKALRLYLREWRREMAAKQGTAAFIVMHDTTLEALCLRRPRTLMEVRGFRGLGSGRSSCMGRRFWML